MVRGRARAAGAGAVVACAAAVAVTIGGCGASSHPNEQRPAVSARISVTIQPHQVVVQPGSVGEGPEPSQQIPQNEGQPQPRIETDKPMAVTIVAANQTGEDAQLVIRGAKELKPGPVFARSPATFQAALPAGSYTVVAADVDGARPGHFRVGPYRASSQNDLLLP
jgi:hypothetical protein